MILPTFGLDQLMNIIEGAVLSGAELVEMNWQMNWKTTSAWYCVIEVVSAKQTVKLTFSNGLTQGYSSHCFLICLFFCPWAELYWHQCHLSGFDRKHLLWDAAGDNGVVAGIGDFSSIDSEGTVDISFILAAMITWKFVILCLYFRENSYVRVDHAFSSLPASASDWPSYSIS